MEEEKNRFKTVLNIIKFVIAFIVIAIIIFIKIISFGTDSEGAAIKIYNMYHSIIFRHDIERVRTKIDEHLKEKYDQELIISSIRTGLNDGDNCYKARIYLKGKRGDSYFYGDAILDVNLFGLKEVKDSYESILAKNKTRQYYLTKLTKLFGEDIVIKTKAYSVRYEDGFIYKPVFPSQKIVEEIKNDPGKRFELTLEVYIFNTLNNEMKRNEIREKIYQLVTELKSKELFEYLELGVFFIDKRFFAPDYRRYIRYMEASPTTAKWIGDTAIYLPIRKNRLRMSRELQAQLDEMTDEEIDNKISNMDIDNLTYKDVRRENGQYYCWVVSTAMMKKEHPIQYNDIEEEGRLDDYDYDKLEEVKLIKNPRYIYINN